MRWYSCFVQSELEISTVVSIEISLLLMYKVNSELEELSEARSEAKEELGDACLLLLWHICTCIVVVSMPHPFNLEWPIGTR